MFIIMNLILHCIYLFGMQMLCLFCCCFFFTVLRVLLQPKRAQMNIQLKALSKTLEDLCNICCSGHGEIMFKCRENSGLRNLKSRCIEQFFLNGAAVSLPSLFMFKAHLRSIFWFQRRNHRKVSLTEEDVERERGWSAWFVSVESLWKHGLFYVA